MMISVPIIADWAIYVSHYLTHAFILHFKGRNFEWWIGSYLFLYYVTQAIILHFKETSNLRCKC